MRQEVLVIGFTVESYAASKVGVACATVPANFVLLTTTVT
jgi:hypothetical protein